MAFNLKTLGTRALSSFVFVLLLLGCVTWNYLSFTLFFLFIGIGALHEFFNMVARMGITPLRGAGYVCGLLLYLLFVNMERLTGAEQPREILLVALLVPSVMAAVSVFRGSENAVSAGIFTTAGVIYCILPFALLHKIVFETGTYVFAPAAVLGVIFLIWTNDTFAYLTGSLLGRHKMAEKISPGKTWEGTAGGVIVAFAASFLIRDYLIGDSSALWPILGVTVPILATIGDLAQSMLKRQAGVKDSGRIMPGHGGILDRFDSLIFVAPFATVLLLVLDAY